MLSNQYAVVKGNYTSLHNLDCFFTLFSTVSEFRW